MRSIYCYFFLAVAFIAAFSITYLEAIKPGDNCASNGGIAPNPLDNTQFYYCLGGKVFMGTCTDGRIFDVNTATCMYPGETGGGGNGGNGGNGGTGGTGTAVNCVNNNYATFPYPTDNTRYYYCLNNQALIVQCPTGSVYSASLKSCTNTGTGTGPSGVCPANITIAIPDPYGNCQNFVLCTNGVPALKTCLYGYYFNPTTRSCGSTIPANCNDSTGMCQQNGQMQAVPNNCQVYNLCNNGGWSTIRCPPGYYFSAARLTCGPTRPSSCDNYNGYFDNASSSFNNVYPPNGNNTQEIVNCSNTPDGKFPNYSNCQTYYMCVNGNMYQMNCASGNYFDFSLQQCTTTLPAGCI